MAIANASQLEAARRRAVPIRFNFVAHVKLELAQPIRCRFMAYLLLTGYVIPVSYTHLTLPTIYSV